VKDRMEVAGYHRKVENKARESHHLTMQDLREIQRVGALFAFRGAYLYKILCCECYVALAVSQNFKDFHIFCGFVLNLFVVFLFYCTCNNVVKKTVPVCL